MVNIFNQKNITYLECIFYQKDKYFSFRRDKPKKVEAMLVVVGLN